jgi:subtilisin family serine protease
MPEDDRGGLPFDDNHSWRSSGDYLNQPAIVKVGIPEARTVTEGEGEIIAILDTGIDTQHPLFVTNHAHFKLAQNFTVFPPVVGVTEGGNGVDGDGDGVADDGVGHGTHVTGIAFTGARKATFMIYKVLDDEGRGTAFGLAKALKAASDYGVDVINLSLGLTTDDRMIHHVIAQCADKGIAVVASAGNRASSDLQYPAAYDEVTSVTAVDNQDVKADFASFGPTVDIAAPGVDIVSPIPSCFGSGKYAAASGGSMATPFVSAAIALEHARWLGMTPVEAARSVVAYGDDVNLMNPLYQSLLGQTRVNLWRPLWIAE